MHSQVLVPILDLNREDLVTLPQLFCIQVVVLWEVYVHKTCQCMTICPQSHITFIISVLVNHLFPESSI